MHAAALRVAAFFGLLAARKRTNGLPREA